MQRAGGGNHTLRPARYEMAGGGPKPLCRSSYHANTRCKTSLAEFTRNLLHLCSLLQRIVYSFQMNHSLEETFTFLFFSVSKSSSHEMPAEGLASAKSDGSMQILEVFPAEVDMDSGPICLRHLWMFCWEVHVPETHLKGGSMLLCKYGTHSLRGNLP